MSNRKYIYWRTDEPAAGAGMQVADVHLLADYNRHSIADYQNMAAELRRTFPEATDGELRCEVIRVSQSCEGFALLRWKGAIARVSYPGWCELDTVPNYSW